mmetsp:Transcript_11837/g.14769  ORF Transcript_11837/g.14769 Transcript_11837/m.14769 type:complete len:328 (-) Transcript_11837:3-986(-)
MTKSKKLNTPTTKNAGIMMILSPTKTLNLEPFTAPKSSSFPPLTTPSCDIKKTKEIAKAMKSYNEKQLAKLLGISAKIAQTAHEYWSQFSLDPVAAADDELTQKPAAYTFSGPAFQGLDISRFRSTADDDAVVTYLQNNLRILDAVYGSLRPLDLMQPYRLDLNTKKIFANDNDATKNNNLAEYWRDSVTTSISDELTGRDVKILANVASDEFAAAIDPSSLPEGTRYVKIVFRQENRVIAVHAKRARGLFVRYVAERGVVDFDGMKGFDAEGYSFVAERSGEDVLEFDRPKQWSVAGKGKSGKRKVDDVVGDEAKGKKKVRNTRKR